MNQTENNTTDLSADSTSSARQLSRVTRTLPELFNGQTQENPDEIAVIGHQGSLSYGELHNEAQRLAKMLARCSETTDEPIGVFAEPSLDLVTGCWGILMSGNGYLPLSPDYPDDRIHYMIQDSGVNVVFAQPHLIDRLQRLVGETCLVLTTEALSSEPEISPLNKLEPRVRPDGLAYVIYTSGSTGKPKGVMIEHQSIVNQLLWLHDTYGTGKDTRIIQKTPMSFDAAQWELLSLALGSTVIMGQPGIHKDPEQLISMIFEYQVTDLQCVPTLLQALLDTVGIHECASLRNIFSGGEILTRQLGKQCLETLPHCQLVNLYGPTECTINASSCTVDSACPEEYPAAIPIGHPVANTTFRIFNDGEEIHKPGVVGELYIGGSQLARGYLHRPDQTRDKFVDVPDSTGTQSERMYRTGDLVYWNMNGSAQFSGRSDNQIKLRGHRIELDEIRLAIEEHPWIKQAAALTVSNRRSGKPNLIACVELNPKEAALMDQGNHGRHHQSKKNKTQVLAQLSGAGLLTSSADDNSQMLVAN